MADLLCRLEKELLEKPYDLVKNAAKGAAFFGTVTVPAAVSDKLSQYGVAANSTNVTQAKDAVNQTVKDYTNQAVSNALTTVDARYDMNHSIHSLNNIGDAAARLNTVMDPSGRLNETFLNNSLAQVRPMVENEIMHYIQFAEDKLTHDMMPYAIIGAAALFLIMFAGGALGSYVGTRIAMRKYNKKSQ